MDDITDQIIKDIKELDEQIEKKEEEPKRKAGRPRVHEEYYQNGAFDKTTYNRLNKDRINELAQKKERCECGASIRIGNRARHRMTHKHQKHIRDVENI